MSGCARNTAMTALRPCHRNRNVGPPEAACRRNWLKAIRALMAFAIAEGFRETDPTAGIRFKVPKSDGHHPWSRNEIAAFEAHWPVGTKQRLAFALLLYTMQRRSDVIRMGGQHVRDGAICIPAAEDRHPTRDSDSSELGDCPLPPRLPNISRSW